VFSKAFKATPTVFNPAGCLCTPAIANPRYVVTASRPYVAHAVTLWECDVVFKMRTGVLDYLVGNEFVFIAMGVFSSFSRHNCLKINSRESPSIILSLDYKRPKSEPNSPVAPTCCNVIDVTSSRAKQLRWMCGLCMKQRHHSVTQAVQRGKTETYGPKFLFLASIYRFVCVYILCVVPKLNLRVHWRHQPWNGCIKYTVALKPHWLYWIQPSACFNCQYRIWSWTPVIRCQRLDIRSYNLNLLEHLYYYTKFQPDQMSIMALVTRKIYSISKFYMAWSRVLCLVSK
jgi:hypothetical protein